MSVNEIAELCSTSRANVYRLMNRGELPWIALGEKSRRVWRSDLMAFLET